MKVQLLICTTDSDYSNHLSRVLSENHPNSFEVTMCSSVEASKNLLGEKGYDAALIGVELIKDIDFNKIRLPLVLWDGLNSVEGCEVAPIKKYQRISSMVSDVLESYSKIAPSSGFAVTGRGRITTVYSPTGGSGKTTVALAFAARMSLSGKSALYLCLEPFCSTSAFFGQDGKSISKVFESLYSGNLEMLLESLVQKDSDTSIMFYRAPENYDDLNELTKENLTTLIFAIAANVDELVIDVGSSSSHNMNVLLDSADNVLLVTDNSWSAVVKFNQFTNQHNTFEKIKAKTTIVANKGARVIETRGAAGVIELPLVNSPDGGIVFKTLSAKEFV